MKPSILVGGQAVIEGVMIRGRYYYAMAVRQSSGNIVTYWSRVNTFLSGSLRDVPMVRGIVVLIETLLIGIDSLNRSANMALEEEGQSLSRWSLISMMGFSLSFGIGLFFLLPLLIARSMDGFILSDGLSSGLEGLLRLAIFIAYIFLIGLMPDIKRVFAYHGAEHMSVHAYEDGKPLEVNEVRAYPKAHNRCGTAFLLTVMMVAIVVFIFVGRPSLPVSILSRIILIPVIASISYEIIRFSGFHSRNPIVKALAYPSIALQSLTTRVPDDTQIEVAICAMKLAVSLEESSEDTFAKDNHPGTCDTSSEDTLH